VLVVGRSRKSLLTRWGSSHRRGRRCGRRGRRRLQRMRRLDLAWLGYWRRTRKDIIGIVGAIGLERSRHGAERQSFPIVGMYFSFAGRSALYPIFARVSKR
jgi:hypothetical protein